jgi:hypothetical protein
VWMPSLATNERSWQPISKLDPGTQKGIKEAFEAVMLKSKKVKEQWAGWTDSINLLGHFKQCELFLSKYRVSALTVAGIAHGLILKLSKTYAKDYQACDYCVKKNHICAQLHANVDGYIAFVGIVPRHSSVILGRDVNDIKYWLG